LRLLDMDVVAAVGIGDEFRPQLPRQPGLGLQQFSFAGRQYPLFRP
jgi:hypothetical protein